MCGIVGQINFDPQEPVDCDRVERMAEALRHRGPDAGGLWSDGPACLSFPSNVANQPIEQFENQIGLIVTEKSLIADSAGVGKFTGGAAQRLSFRSVATKPITAVLRHERVKYPPRGLLGGGPGAAGVDLFNGERVAPKSEQILNTGDVISFLTPGGGGMLPAAERAPEAIRRDLDSGLLSPARARDEYGYKDA